MTFDSRSRDSRSRDAQADDDLDVFSDPMDEGLPDAPMLDPALAMDEESERLLAAARAGDAGAAEEFYARHRPLFSALCNTFEFHRQCPRRACRGARACRGDPSGCYRRQASVLPAAVRGWGIALMSAARQGWPQLKLDINYAEQRFAYRCWIAGLRAGHVRPSYERLLGRLRRGARGDAAGVTKQSRTRRGREGAR